MNLKNGKVFTSKFVGTGPSSYEKRIYRAAVSRSLRNTVLLHIAPCFGCPDQPWSGRYQIHKKKYRAREASVYRVINYNNIVLKTE